MQRNVLLSMYHSVTPRSDSSINVSNESHSLLHIKQNCHHIYLHLFFSFISCKDMAQNMARILSDVQFTLKHRNTSHILVENNSFFTCLNVSILKMALWMAFKWAVPIFMQILLLPIRVMCNISEKHRSFKLKNFYSQV